jgi:hypothetical protein
MSFEWFGNVALNEREVRLLVTALCDHEFVALPGAGSDHFKFRITPAAQRERWAVDIELRTRPALCVAFHSATGEQRQRFLRNVESVLAAMGHAHTLEEA